MYRTLLNSSNEIRRNEIRRNEMVELVVIKKLGRQNFEDYKPNAPHTVYFKRKP